MPQDLNTLIRLNEWTVDERRRELGDILSSLAELESGLHRLREELAREQGVVQASPEEAGFFYGNYAKAVIERRNHLDAGIVRMEEVAQDLRDTQEARELARKEQIDLDELGLQAYRLKKR